MKEDLDTNLFNKISKEGYTYIQLYSVEAGS